VKIKKISTSHRIASHHITSLRSAHATVTSHVMSCHVIPLSVLLVVVASCCCIVVGERHKGKNSARSRYDGNREDAHQSVSVGVMRMLASGGANASVQSVGAGYQYGCQRGTAAATRIFSIFGSLYST